MKREKFDLKARRKEILVIFVYSHVIMVKLHIINNIIYINIYVCMYMNIYVYIIYTYT